MERGAGRLLRSKISRKATHHKPHRMRFNQPDTFLCQAIWLGLYHPSGPTLMDGCGASTPTLGSRFCDTVFLFCDTRTIEPPGIVLCRSVSSDLRPLVRRRFDMQVHGLNQLHGAQNINAPHFNRSAPPATSGASSINTTDELQLSPAAQMAGKLNEIPDIRWDRVNSIRASIADGTYMTDDKLNGAVDRLLDEIA
jgi:negative regulator of flagellin synthesis FlgM